MRHEFLARPEHTRDWTDLVAMGITFLFWVAVIVALFVLANRYMQMHKSGSNPDIQDSIEIAKTRYARGEITREEFNKLIKDLS